MYRVGYINSMGCLCVAYHKEMTLDQAMKYHQVGHVIYDVATGHIVKYYHKGRWNDVSSSYLLHLIHCFIDHHRNCNVRSGGQCNCGRDFLRGEVLCSGCT